MDVACLSNAELDEDGEEAKIRMRYVVINEEPKIRMSL
jgi:hypothetical protein